MTEADISPLARRLAEENNVDWRKLKGTGADGKVVERDVLEYLARVMSGQEDVDPTPEPLPDGMEEWPEEDIAAYRRGARERAQGGLESEPTAVEDAEIDEDIFLFEDDAAHVHDDEAADHEDVFAMAGGAEIEESEDLFLDFSADEDFEEEEDEVVGVAAPEHEPDPGLGSMDFELDEPAYEAPRPGRGARADVRDLAFVGAEEDAPSPAAAAAPSARAVAASAPEGMVTRSEPEVQSAREIPLVRHGRLFRRHLELTAVENAQAALGRELERDEPLGVAPFLLRAAGKALAAHPIGSGSVAWADVEHGLTYVNVGDGQAISFRDLVARLESSSRSADVPAGTALVVVDLSALEVDEAVLDAGVPVLALGRVLYDDQAGGVRGTLSISGDIAPDLAGRILAQVADLLAAPVRLLI